MAITGTKEWAEHSWNIAAGCAHDCRYCYAKAMAVRFGRCRADEWAAERVDMAKVCRRWGKREGRIMFPTTHDITPTMLPHAIRVLRAMLSAGNRVLVVSKPHLACVKALCSELAEWREQVMFRFTIGSLDAATLRFWEPGAPGPLERIAALAHAHAAGYSTSVSCEPTLDAQVERVVAAVAPFVTDSIWIGKANSMAARLRHNGADEDHVAAGRALVESQNDVAIRALYERLRLHTLVKWKESIKSVVGLELAQSAGLDV